MITEEQMSSFVGNEFDMEPSLETLLRLAELVLSRNCFSFADIYNKQINGVAMGTKMEPSYANLFASYIEDQFLNHYNGPKHELYVATLTTLWALFLLPERNSINL